MSVVETIHLNEAMAVQNEHPVSWSLYEENTAYTGAVRERFNIACYLEGLADGIATQGNIKDASRLWEASEILRAMSGLVLAPIEHTVGEHARAAAPFTERRPIPVADAPQRQAAIREHLAGESQAVIGEKRSGSPPAGLTAREVEILRLVAQGMTDAQVAEQLVISPRTVNWHLTSIYCKLGVSSRCAATRYAIEQHVV